ncbi:hypothetical protein P9314_00040 [Paenibacillus validus]|uniref:NEAT domain-containing protein n=1 Tax=Paenibacillus validus TaxID=44253 RepID=A0A7X2Z6I6_9BACL|nr:MULTISPECIES: hypothetical protein [Paenibacillus]MED4599102.1 hypothetical protein [Paenibacillus validus]MED4608394.1 hypothetical protein [Paenibacillus validus]MUG69182.1 hypothetical protein [Paenibacillus validus]
MRMSMKKTFSMMLMLFVFALALAVPAFAAASNYEFLDAAGNPSPHASSFTNDAVVSGSTVTVHYDTDYIYGLKVYNSATDAYDTITGTVSGDFIYFTFDVADFEENLPVQLGVNAGPHSGYMNLQIKWNL